MHGLFALRAVHISLQQCSKCGVLGYLRVINGETWETFKIAASDVGELQSRADRGGDHVAS